MSIFTDAVRSKGIKHNLALTQLKVNITYISISLCSEITFVNTRFSQRTLTSNKMKPTRYIEKHLNEV